MNTASKFFGVLAIIFFILCGIDMLYIHNGDALYSLGFGLVCTVLFILIHWENR
jgi:uncharacterized membrane protein